MTYVIIRNRKCNGHWFKIAVDRQAMYTLQVHHTYFQFVVVGNYFRRKSATRNLFSKRKGSSKLGSGRLCQHNFEHNRYLKASSIMPA